MMLALDCAARLRLTLRSAFPTCAQRLATAERIATYFLRYFPTFHKICIAFWCISSAGARRTQRSFVRTNDLRSLRWVNFLCQYGQYFKIRIIFMGDLFKYHQKCVCCVARQRTASWNLANFSQCAAAVCDWSPPHDPNEVSRDFL